MRLVPLSPKEVIKVLDKLGFKPVRQEGSHVFFRHPDGRTATVPVHPGKDIGRGLLRKIMGDMGISRGEFLELLGKK